MSFYPEVGPAVPEGEVAPQPEALDRARFEQKLLLDEPAALAVEIAVAAELPRRRFPGGERTLVTTVYLDRPDGALGRRVLAGVGSMARLRLKAYRGAGAAGPVAALALEVKRTRGGRTRKVRAWLAPSELPIVLSHAPASRWRGLHLARLVPVAVPSCVLSYERTVYEAEGGELRVTVDRRLGAETPSEAVIERLSRGEVPKVAPAAGAPVVVEVKSLGRLPPWLAELVKGSTGSFSKLAWALARTGPRR